MGEMDTSDSWWMWLMVRCWLLVVMRLVVVVAMMMIIKIDWTGGVTGSSRSDRLMRRDLRAHKL